jgi:hypothetical protein
MKNKDYKKEITNQYGAVCQTCKHQEFRVWTTENYCHKLDIEIPKYSKKSCKYYKIDSELIRKRKAQELIK